MEKTPLHIAVINNDYNIINLLLANNANINIKDNNDKRAFEYTKNKDIIKLKEKYKQDFVKSKKVNN